MCPEKRTGSQSESECYDAKVTVSKKQYVSPNGVELVLEVTRVPRVRRDLASLEQLAKSAAPRGE